MSEVREAELALEVAYWSESVGCFDPERVLVRVAASFPDAEFDPTDHAEREVASVERFLAEDDGPDENKASMRRQITGKARRNGPVYRFRLRMPSGAAVDGGASRYRVWLRPCGPLAPEERGRLHAFLASLELGTPKLTGEP